MKGAQGMEKLMNQRAYLLGHQNHSSYKTRTRESHKYPGAKFFKK